MSGEPATILQITATGYQKACASEQYGFLAELKQFRLGTKSMPLSPELPWGDQVYVGPVTDYTLVMGNTILLTCFVPPEVPTADVDSIAIYIGDDGTIFAQGMFNQVRTVRENAGTFIYLYINAPEPAELVEASLLSHAMFPQVQDYCDLPAAHETSRHEYVVNNGHCGMREEQPEFLPMMVMLSASDPADLLFPPNEPFLDPDVGTLSTGDYAYQVTAVNAAGESLPSPQHAITLLPLPTPVCYLERGYGTLATGTHYYQVVAVSPGGGRTIGSAEIGLAVTKLATPSAPVLSIDVGGLDAGTYWWSVAAINDYGQTVAGTETSATVPDDSGVTVTWSAVSGASGYAVYRRTGTGGKQLVTRTSSTVIIDYGLPADEAVEAPATATDCGVLVKWDKVDGAIEYEIYGRVTGGAKQRLEVVPYDQFQWFDTGAATPAAPAVSTSNDTQSGVEVKWTPVLGALSYNVYGRVDGALGFLANVAAPTVNWIDDGSAVVGVAPPTDMATLLPEWQLVDGTCVHRGPIDACDADTVTINGLPDNSWDSGLLTVIAGTGLYQTRHVKYEGSGVFRVVDRAFDPVLNTGDSEVAVWVGPGCCGGGPCPDSGLGVVYGDPLPIPTEPPRWSWLGVHICGRFLGQTTVEEAQTSDVNFVWNGATAPNLVSSGGLDHLFCDENGRTVYDLPINNPVVTPHGNRFPYGEFSSTAEAAQNAVRFTLDAVAVAPGIRFILYSQPNFSGSILLDITGPAYIVNWVWRSRAAFSYALDDSVWNGTAGQIIPANRRFWSDDTRLFSTPQDMHQWRGTSFQVIRPWL